MRHYFVFIIYKYVDYEENVINQKIYCDLLNSKKQTRNFIREKQDFILQENFDLFKEKINVKPTNKFSWILYNERDEKMSFDVKIREIKTKNKTLIERLKNIGYIYNTIIKNYYIFIDCTSKINVKVVLNEKIANDILKLNGKSIRSPANLVKLNENFYFVCYLFK